MTLRDYHSGCALEGSMSPTLLKASLEAQPTGAVNAYRDSSGVWQYVAAQDVEHYSKNLREAVWAVYVDGV